MSAARRRARIPANIDQPDRLVWGLTARQLLIVAAATLIAWAVGLAARLLVPLPVAVALVTPLLSVGLVLALARVGGLSADQLAVAALRYHRSPRRLVPTSEPIAPPPAWIAAQLDAGAGLPAPLELPAGGLDQDGVIDLGEHGRALVCRASSVNFSLRTEAEQDALVAAFARFLHSVSAPVQVLVHAQRADLRASVAELERHAAGLPHPALEAAACAHARHLDELAARRDVLRRELLVCFRQPRTTRTTTRQDAVEAGVLRRRAEEAAALLTACGITLTPLTQDEAIAVLAQAVAPDTLPLAPGRSIPGQTITAARTAARRAG